MTNTKMLYLRANVVARGDDDARPRVALLPIDDELFATLKAKSREIDDLAPGVGIALNGDRATWLGSERQGGCRIYDGPGEHGSQGPVQTVIRLDATGMTVCGVTVGDTRIATPPLRWADLWMLLKRPDEWVYQPSYSGEPEHQLGADTFVAVQKASREVYEALCRVSDGPSERRLVSAAMGRLFPKDMVEHAEGDHTRGLDDASRLVAEHAEESVLKTKMAETARSAFFGTTGQEKAAVLANANLLLKMADGDIIGTPHAVSGLTVDGERRLFVRASADESGEMEEPEWAQIKIDQAFLDELAGYRRSMDAVNAFEIRAQGTPWAWRPDRNGEERYGESFDGEYIVCSPHGFHYVALGEHGGSINTREVSFAELERMLAEPHELMVQTDEPNGARSSVLAELEEHFEIFDDSPAP